MNFNRGSNSRIDVQGTISFSWDIILYKTSVGEIIQELTSKEQIPFLDEWGSNSTIDVQRTNLFS